jgi:hypothetical protein
MSEWAEPNIIPGKFTGSTDANVLTGDQLNDWTRNVTIVLFYYAFNHLKK